MASADLTDFRNRFLTKAKATLLAVDVENADRNTLIINSALLRGYDSVNKFDAIGPDAIYLLTLMTGAELDTYLSDPANAASFEAILASTEARTALLNSSTAMTAVAASSTAMAAVAASSTAMAAVIASSTAMAAVIASSTAMTAVAASSTAMAAVIASSTAMAAVIASSTAMTAVAASATAVSAMNASATAKTALYNSPIRTLILKAGASWQQPFMAVSSGSGLFVKAVHANSFPGNNGLKIDGVYVPASKVSTYDVITRYTTSLGIDWYFDQSELVYIPC